MIRQKTTHLVQLCSSRTIGCHFEDDCGAAETRKCFAPNPCHGHGALAAAMRATRIVEDEIAKYLEQHQHDLPPALRIELERRRTG
jgi:hypothetical protein